MAVVVVSTGAGYVIGQGSAAAGVEAGPALAFRLLMLAAGLIGIVGIFLRPELGLLMLAGLLYTNASEPVVRYYEIPSPLQIVTFVTAAAAALRLWGGAGTTRQLVLDPLLVPIACYGIVVFSSSLAATNPGLADDKLSEHLKGMLIFLLATNLIATPLDLRRVIWVLVLSGALLAVISVYQVVTGSYDQEFFGFGHVKVAEIVAKSRKPRIAGSLSDPNFYAQVLVMLVPLALYRLWDEVRPLLKAVAGCALSLIMLAAVFTFSRGGAIALALVLVLAFAQRRVRRDYVLLGLAAALPLALLLPQNFTARLVTLIELAPSSESAVLSHEDSSIHDRRRLMTVAWQMFADYPLLGVGAGSYGDRFDEYADHVGMTVSSFDKFGHQRFPHNLYLQLAAETGLAGLLTFAAAVAGTFRSLRRAHRTFTKHGDAMSADLVVSLGLANIAFLATSLFLHGAYIRYFWLLVAISAAAGQVAQRTATVHAGD